MVDWPGPGLKKNMYVRKTSSNLHLLYTQLIRGFRKQGITSSSSSLDTGRQLSNAPSHYVFRFASESQAPTQNMLTNHKPTHLFGLSKLCPLVIFVLTYFA